MKKFISLIVVTALFFVPCRSRADLFGGDVAILSQILIQTIQQLATMKQVLGKGADTLDLVRRINEGIDQCLPLLKTIYPNLDSGIYKDWANAQDALREVTRLYGEIVPSPEAQIEKDADQSIAEVVALNNEFYKWTSELDIISEQIKSAAHGVSPTGAQKMTAQALGLVIQGLNQNLRAQATGLKLQAQSMAIENRHAKESTKDVLGTGMALQAAFKSEKAKYTIPRF